MLGELVSHVIGLNAVCTYLVRLLIVMLRGLIKLENNRRSEWALPYSPYGSYRRLESACRDRP
jgi:hypothetical protein